MAPSTHSPSSSPESGPSSSMTSRTLSPSVADQQVNYDQQPARTTLKHNTALSKRPQHRDSWLHTDKRMCLLSTALVGPFETSPWRPSNHPHGQALSMMTGVRTHTTDGSAPGLDATLVPHKPKPSTVLLTSRYQGSDHTPMSSSNEQGNELLVDIPSREFTTAAATAGPKEPHSQPWELPVRRLHRLTDIAPPRLPGPKLVAIPAEPSTLGLPSGTTNTATPSAALTRNTSPKTRERKRKLSAPNDPSCKINPFRFPPQLNLVSAQTTSCLGD